MNAKGIPNRTDESVDSASKLFFSEICSRTRKEAWFDDALPSEHRRGLESKSVDAAELFAKTVLIERASLQTTW